MKGNINGYNLSRNWFNFCFANPEKIKPNHGALYFFCIEQCNRLGWKEKFGLPSSLAMETVGIKSHNTYLATVRDLVEFGFIKIIEKSKNQFTANIIALVNFDKAPIEALDRALINHTTKQGESTYQSTDSINKQETINQKQETTNKGGKQSLHSILKEDFIKWYKWKKKVDYYWTAKDGNNLKLLIKKLEFSIKSENMPENDEHIQAAFQNLLNMNNDEWIKDNLSISIINSKYNELIAKIKSSPDNFRQRIIAEMQEELG